MSDPLDNLKSYKPGEQRAKDNGSKGGKAKAGSRHLKTIIQEIGHNIDWDKTTLKDKDKMKQLYGSRAWDALVYVAFTKAMAGDIKAMDWLAKNGYGTNIDITSEGEKIQAVTVIDLGNLDADQPETE